MIDLGVAKLQIGLDTYGIVLLLVGSIVIFFLLTKIFQTAYNDVARHFKLKQMPWHVAMNLFILLYLIGKVLF